VEDFVAADEESLGPWLSNLEKMAILTEIEEDFRFVKQIGDGSFATVHLAIKLSNSTKCAIKSIQKASLASPITKQLLTTEIRTLRKINHPNVVKIHRVYEEAEIVHLVMELAQGTTLLDLICYQEFLEEPIAAVIAKQLLETIRDCHAMGVVHRDLKLENVMVTPEYKIQLIDFGMCATVPPGTESIRGICGSPGYIAPEICTRDCYGMKVDLFSIGVITYVLICGELPFNGRNIEKKLEANVKCKLKF
jgi:serine/threonine protein kinase